MINHDVTGKYTGRVIHGPNEALEVMKYKRDLVKLLNCLKIMCSSRWHSIQKLF